MNGSLRGIEIGEKFLQKCRKLKNYNGWSYILFQAEQQLPRLFPLLVNFQNMIISLGWKVEFFGNIFHEHCLWIIKQN